MFISFHFHKCGKSDQDGGKKAEFPSARPAKAAPKLMNIFSATMVTMKMERPAKSKWKGSSESLLLSGVARGVSCQGQRK